MDVGAVRAAFDAQVRRRADDQEAGGVVEHDGDVLRWVAPGTQVSCIVWSQLTADTADAAIAAQRAYFTARGTPAEWKYYDYDSPANLRQRLLAAGFEAGAKELMLVAETASISNEVVLPDGVRLEPVTDEAGVDALLAVRALAFDDPSPDLGPRLAEQLRAAPESLQIVVAMAGDEPISAARIEFVSGTEFAGLWGGGTIPAWRRKGIFRALVAYRAGLAAARGYRYLQVDALPTSQPILERLGFHPVATTIPYTFTPRPATLGTASAWPTVGPADTMGTW
jgi:GNAT superfamily N-acetyltransferase